MSEIDSKLPEQVWHVLCENVRPELNNKMTILGFFPTEKIVMSRNTQPPDNQVTRLEELAIVSILQGGSGIFPCKFELTDPTGGVLAGSDLPPADFTKSDGVTVVIKFQQFVVPHFGFYTYGLYVGSQRYNFRFEIVEA